MSGSRSVLSNLSLRLYRVLLGVYPRSFRVAYGRDLLETFGDRLDAVRRERGVWGLGGLWARTMRDVIGNAAAARAEGLGVGSGGRSGALSGGGGGNRGDRPRSNLVESAFQDLAYALRSLRKHAGFATVVILTLGLGIGANAAIFSVVRAVLLAPLPYGDPDQLVMVWGFNPGIGREVASLPDFIDWREQNTTFSHMSAGTVQSVNIAAGGAETERLRGARVSHGFFRMMGVAPIIGREPTEAEDRPGAERVVVLGHGLWQRGFGGDSAVVGQSVNVHGNMHVIVGVAPPGFDFPRNADLWMPLALDPNRFGRRGDFLTVVGRLRDGVSLEQAQTEMTGIAARLEEEYPASNTGWTVQLVSLHEQIVGEVRLPLLVFSGAVGLVLLIVCANVANLLLARGAGRATEMALRAALGAGRGRLLRQLLTETGLLAVIGGGVGLVLATFGVDALVALSPEGVPRLEGARVDGLVLAFAAVLSVGTGMLFGLAPAWQMSRTDVAASLKQGGSRTSSGVSSLRSRGALVVGEVALAIVLLIGAGLMLRSFLELRSVDPGFEPAGVATMRISLPSSQYPDAQARLGFYDPLVERIRSLPGVTAVGLVSDLPATGGGNYLSFAVEGRPPPSNSRSMVQDAHLSIVSPAYFQAVGIPVLRGRGFSQQDREDSEEVALINETMGRQYWPDEDPIGQRFTFGNPQSGRWFTIVGVVRDVRDQGLDSEPYAQVYRPFVQSVGSSMGIVVKAESDLSALVAAVRREVRAMDPGLAVYDAMPLTEVLAETIVLRRFVFMVVTVFAVVAMILAAVGLYGVMSYSVAERSNEIGVRMALGATRAIVLRQVVGQGAAMVAVGGAIGVVVSAFVTRLIATLLFGVRASDPVTYLGVIGVLALAAGAASCIPALRASRVDPMATLRDE